MMCDCLYVRKAADKVAKGRKLNRFALLRQALQEHLRREGLMDLEERDRRGYQAQPQRIEEYLLWEGAAASPEDCIAVMSLVAVCFTGTNSGIAHALTASRAETFSAPVFRNSSGRRQDCRRGTQSACATA